MRKRDIWMIERDSVSIQVDNNLFILKQTADVCFK